MWNREACKHFNGIQHNMCEAGVCYETVKFVPPKGMIHLPCLRHPELPCAKREYPTQEEVDAEAKLVEEALAAMSVGKCPVCGKDVQPVKKIGRCEYAACGHRMGQV